jgi:23S rRNA (uridine2552-2'-O)-methyltransferase
VYKFQELCEKFSLLPKRTPFRALDLGAAPGSWSLFLLRQYRDRYRAAPGTDAEGEGPFLAAADLSPLSRQYDRGLFEEDHFFFLQGDFTLAENRAVLLAKGPYHLVASDAAPATTGNRRVDSLRSLALAEEALVYAEEALVPGGSLVVKIFQGGGETELLARIRKLFKTGRACKPRASRPGSFETYFLGLGKR